MDNDYNFNVPYTGRYANTYKSMDGMDYSNGLAADQVQSSYVPPAVGGSSGSGVGSGTGGSNNTPVGLSRNMANAQAGAGIGLGLLGFLENRKTAKLQREALRNDISTAKEHRANRAALGASWNRGLQG